MPLVYQGGVTAGSHRVMGVSRRHLRQYTTLQGTCQVTGLLRL